jgi:hypothetical protein
MQTFLASESISINQCVSLTTTPALVSRSTEGKVVLGVSATTVAAGQPVVFQDGPAYQVIAEGTITSGDLLVPGTTPGSLIKSVTGGQFIAIESKTSGNVFNAYRA